MKINFVLVFFLLSFSIPAYSQYKQSQYPPCNGDTLKKIISMETSMLLNSSGINLNKYDWKNPTINCHINSVARLYPRQAVNMRIGVSVGAMGIGGILSGAVAQSYDGSGGGLIALGSIVTAGGVYLVHKAITQKKQLNAHLNIIGQYYRDSKL